MFLQIDTYSKVATAKLYVRMNARTGADTLNDVILLFFEEQELPLLRILTDWGTEYCGWDIYPTIFPEKFLRKPKHKFGLTV